MQDLQNRIDSLEAAMETDRKKTIRLQIINHELDILRKDLLKSNQKLKKEKRDVDELEKKNMKSLFTEILGDKEEQLERERQEYLQEVLHHNSLIDEIETLKYEEKILKENLSKDRLKIERELKNVMSLKEKQLKGSPQYKKQLLKFDAQLHKLHYRLVNIEEAIEQGRFLRDKLKSVFSKLKQVKKWGPYKMHGKGRYSSYNKKTYIDKANREAVIANVFIKKFDKELKDVFPDLDMNLSMEYFENFLDQFYDNLITDWMIQRKLDNAVHNISTMEDKMQRILMTLEKEKESVNKEQSNIESEKAAYIKSNP
ncbi:MAG: hypothetical protein HKN68_13615 [Saprospiraceae bacterium]|nr:hypothetical protein [Saprospiraceae bacterium]